MNSTGHALKENNWSHFASWDLVIVLKSHNTSDVDIHCDIHNRYFCYIIHLVPHPFYHQIFNIRCILAGYKIVDHTYVAGASPVVAAPTTSSFST